MLGKWQWIFKQLTSRLWLRASFFCLIAIAAALLGFILKNYIPSGLAQDIGADAVSDVLNIIASSMLAVTTFSLSVMVAAYAAAANSAAPRSLKLLLSDKTSQNSISTFIGSFLFSLVGIIGLKMGIYGETGRFFLFIMTIAVILFIVLTLLQWIEHLSRLGRVGETIDMVEAATVEAINDLAKQPYLGGVAWPASFKPNKNYTAITHHKIGYLQYIDMASLDRIAQRIEKPIYLDVRPGAFNDSIKNIAFVNGSVSEEDLASICRCFSIGDSRSFEQDACYGLIVLSEIASRALSPAVNDPGTAIDVIGTLVRALSPLALGEEQEPKYKHVKLPSFEAKILLDHCFKPIARDGASMIEVVTFLQKGLKSLAKIGNGQFKTPAEETLSYVRAHAQQALRIKEDKAAI
ncbi:MAG: hypothetical protein CMH30_03280 [Micavibrio sp.]|nr:hypothetical protein [Micavibrio sp.]